MVQQNESFAGVKSDGIIESLVRYDEPDSNSNLPRELRASFARNSDRELIVDTASGRRWTGAKLLEASQRVATNLIKQLKVKPNDIILTICDHTDHEIVFALGAMFAGAAIFGAMPTDGIEEFVTLCELNKPDVIITESRMHLEVERLCKSVQGLSSVPLIWIDNPTIDTTASIKSNLNQENNNNNNNCIDHNNLDLKIEQNDQNNNIISSADEQQNGGYLRMIQEKQVVLFDHLLNGGEEIDEELICDVVNRQIDPQNHALTYLLTSGSTGKPKVVPTLQAQMLHQIMSIYSATKNPIGSASGESNDKTKILLPFTRDSIIAGDLPLDHGAGLDCMFLSFMLGSKLIIMPSYDELSYWQAVSDYGITHSIASTTFTCQLIRCVKEMIKSGEIARRGWNLNSLNYMSCAGAKLAIVDSIREVQQTYPQLKVTQAYGCTEIGYISSLPADESHDHIDSVGYLYPGLKAKIVDFETRLPVPVGSRGELCLDSKTKFSTYKCYPGEDVEAIMRNCHESDGFYRTGDSVHMDTEGRFYIHGRIKETLFLVEDWKILPAELEQVVDKHPLVEQTAIIGVPSLEWPGTDAPRAFVKLISIKSKQFTELSSRKELVDGVSCGDLCKKLEQGDSKFMRDHIYQFVANRTAKPKHLKGGIYFLENDFPRNGILKKVDRKALKLIQV